MSFSKKKSRGQPTRDNRGTSQRGANSRFLKKIAGAGQQGTIVGPANEVTPTSTKKTISKQPRRNVGHNPTVYPEFPVSNPIMSNVHTKQVDAVVSLWARGEGSPSIIVAKVDEKKMMESIWATN